MASDLNVVALTGRLTRDSELRYTNGGTSVCFILLFASCAFTIDVE